MAAASGLLAASSIAAPALGASHREAPLISYDPSADITDLYAFVSPDRPNTVTLIANYHPFQEPAGGPNFYPFNPFVQYWIKVDNTGDGVEDVTYTFQFDTDVANPESFLYSGYGPIGSVDANVTQTYTVERNGVPVATDVSVPPPDIGPRTTGVDTYPQFVDDAIARLDSGGRTFAGQRDDPFFVDLGAIFDLGGLRPFNEAHLIDGVMDSAGDTVPLQAEPGEDTLAGYNVNTIALQLPKSALTSDGEDVRGPNADNAVIGVWAGASRAVPSLDGDDIEFVQVSRLGNPLINEVVIPIGDKDEWNASSPADDIQYADHYLEPELAAIIATVYPGIPTPRTNDREDLVLILGQGIPGVNQTNEDGLYDMLRLNMGIEPAATPEILGAVAGDLAGFPNGRRLIDDVTDIEIRAIADGYGEFLNEQFGLPNNEPNNVIGDGCDQDDQVHRDTFPYVGEPRNGYRSGTLDELGSCGA